MTMVSGGGICLYREARLNIEPAFPESTIAITLPANTPSTFGPRTVPKRVIVSEKYIDQDEEAFAKRHLASEGSIFFRRHHGCPRSFLWRLLDNRRTLEIQCADLDQDITYKVEANLTLLLNFTAPIRPFGIALAESEDHDAIIVFAITSSNELYTLTLHREFFMNKSATDQDINNWCKKSTPNLIGLRSPYRLVALSEAQLLVSLDDGGILHLQKQANNDGTWTETLYKQNNWSLGSLLPWKGQHTIRFGDLDLDATSAAATALSPDGKHIFTVCLDHRLRVWNVFSGRPTIQLDLLGEPDQPTEKTASYFIGPSQNTLLAILDIPGGVGGATYHVITYSPKQHQFKFWGVRDADDDSLGIFEISPEVDFIPPVDELMNTTVWTLEEFAFNRGPAGWRGAELWIRARSGPSSKVYVLKFDLMASVSNVVARAWKRDWVCVDSGSLTVDGLKHNAANPSEQDMEMSELTGPGDAEQWLDFLFYPGRFTTATLETALLVFRRGLTQSRTLRQSRHTSLKERILGTITAFVSAANSKGSDNDRYDDIVGAQWQAFYSIIKDLHKRRGECLSLVFDYAKDTPWLVLSDYFSAVRTCSEVEFINLNAARLSASSPAKDRAEPLRKHVQDSGIQHTSTLLNAAAALRKSLPLSFHRQFELHLQAELLQTQSLSVLDRMEFLEQSTDLSHQVTDDDLSAFLEEVEVKDLRTDSFLDAIRILTHESEGRNVLKKQVSRYGLSALLRVSQETLEVNHNALLDLLVLILYIQFDEDTEHLDPAEVFVEIVGQLKDNMIICWLASNAWSRQSPTGPASEVMLKSLSESYNNSRVFPMTQTVLEGIFGHRAFDSPFPSSKKAGLLTYWSHVWMSQVFADQSYDSSLEEIMMILLTQKDYDLALRFSKFLPEESWTTYLKGRLHIALGEYSIASTYLQKAAYHLALGMFNIHDTDTVGFLSTSDRNSFSDGLPKYYYHILGLFDKVKAYSYVADFAHLALRSCATKQDEASKKEENALKNDILSRLFNASIQTSRWNDAYSALTRHTDAASRRSDELKKLVDGMVQRDAFGDMLKLPFVGLIDEVDDILVNMCQLSLNVASGPPHHQMLYAFRISRNNFRGAASILYERLQRLKTTSSKIHDPEDESLIQCYVMIINTLSSVNEEEAYILAEQKIDDSASAQWGIGKAKMRLKRQVITLDTLRKEYQAELDRVTAIEDGQYPFVEAEEMDFL
ncbi:hypothetical protein EJ04DRAFT_464730 [Polyplosphaeria fusca]|uniref:Nuclear pore complex protein Nup160 n=1 Tax=Polyplosphaeria fusca TaxID=682080 RepID=A0A9P4QZ01_9PLEO|nr:hypothetical protein EJ04DRAFT_464730 [Polyplosphaeria fusca]